MWALQQAEQRAHVCQIEAAPAAVQPASASPPNSGQPSPAVMAAATHEVNTSTGAAFVSNEKCLKISRMIEIVVICVR
jgi:hypothetical protein